MKWQDPGHVVGPPLATRSLGAADAGRQGINAVALDAAIAEVLDHETRAARDMRAYLGAILSQQSHRDVLGPLRDAEGASGVIVRHGGVVGQWGNPTAVEMSFSATKTYLSAIAGLAFDRYLLADIDQPVADSVDDVAFSGRRHGRITWRHLLHQTSAWSGELWGVPSWADPQSNEERGARLGEPGTVWAYNDVRINLLALALTRLWRRPLGDVLRTELMEPIGCSATWAWYGYRNSFAEIDGERVSVVSGGAHWGGGLWASAWDHARFGLLFLRGGRWADRQILSREWINLALEPCPQNPSYGALWWLNTKRDVFPQAPSSGYCARGNLGRQLVWVDPDRDLVVVSRWADDVGDLLAAVTAAIN